MARIRTIKPRFWGSGTTARMSRDERLLSLILISMADDEGRFLASPAAILGYGYPNDDKLTPAHVRRWLAGVEEAEFIVTYEVAGVRCGVIPKYRDHQRISHPQASSIPAPPLEGLFE